MCILLNYAFLYICTEVSIEYINNTDNFAIVPDDVTIYYMHVYTYQMLPPLTSWGSEWNFCQAVDQIPFLWSGIVGMYHWIIK